MAYDLQPFVRESLAKGLSKSQIRTALLKAGWQKEEIESELSVFADVDFPLPVPKRKPYLSAREAFLYLVLFLTLYISAWSIGTILFQVINLYIPDAAFSTDYYLLSSSRTAIRSATSALVVTAPIFAWLSYVINRSQDKNPLLRSSKVRKWLTYLTLFVAAGVIIGSLITLVYNVLGGELTARFSLKLLTVLTIAGCIFGYYLWDLRRDEQQA